MAIFDYPTNFSNGTSIDSLGNLISYGHYVTSGWFATAFLFIIAVISFMLGGGASRGFLTSGFITFIFSVYFVRLGIINPFLVFLALFMIIVGLLTTKTERTSI